MPNQRKCPICQCFTAKGDVVWHITTQDGRKRIAHENCLDNEAMLSSSGVVIKDTGLRYTA